MEDRTAPPVRRHGGIADPDVFDPERAGIDYERRLPTADAHNLERKTRDDHLPIGYSEREPPDDAVDVRIDRDFPSGQRRGTQIGLALQDGFVALQERRRIVSRLADRGGLNRARRSREHLPAG